MAKSSFVQCLDRGIACSFRMRRVAPLLVHRWELGRCTRLRLILLRVGNDDFATTKKTRVQRKCTRTKQYKRHTDDRKV